MAFKEDSAEVLGSLGFGGSRLYEYHFIVNNQLTQWQHYIVGMGMREPHSLSFH